MAARTLAQLQASVQALGFGTDTATQQAGWLNDEYRAVAGLRRWQWLQGEATFATVAGTSSYTPGALRNLDSVRVADAQGNEQYMEYKPINFVLDKLHRFNQLTDRGAPRYWTWFQQKVYLYPIPDAVYTVQYEFVSNITAMASAGDTTLMPEAYDEILVWGAAARGFVRQNNWLQRDFAQSQRQALLNAMLAEYGKDQTQNSDEVEWSGMWNSPTRPWR